MSSNKTLRINELYLYGRFPNYTDTDYKAEVIAIVSIEQSLCKRVLPTNERIAEYT